MRDGAHRADAAPARLIRAGIAALFLVALGGAAQIMGGGSGQTATGPNEDRVGLPADYRTTFTHVRSAPLENGTQVLVVYANDRAASVTDRANVPYPYGSIFVAEWRHAVLDETGTPLRDADGRPRAGELFQIDVMRREPGFGAAYGDARTGEWEYVRYRTDGRHLIPPARSQWCAACHRNAGEGRDWVFHGRF
jgi:hypothetical protein